MFVGWGRAEVVAEVVAEAVPLAEVVEGDRPTMAVSFLVVEDVVAVAFCLPEVVDVRGMPRRPLELSEEGLLEKLPEGPGIEFAVLLDKIESGVTDKDCVHMHCVSRIQGKRYVMEGIMRMLR